MVKGIVAGAAFSAALAITAGAFGAHAASGQAVEWLRTGASYQLIHAVAVVILADRARRPAWLLLVGSLIFALTLYAMALGGPRILGAVTPIGGVLMIVGWLWFAVQSLLSRNAATSSKDTDLST